MSPVSAFAARHILAAKPVSALVPPPGYMAWYDAAQIAGQADNTPLASWLDSSGGGNPVVQATGATQPTYYKTTAGKTVNGLPAVWFTTAQWMMTAAAIQSVSPTNGAWSAFMVAVTSATGGTAVPLSSDYQDGGGGFVNPPRVAQFFNITSTSPSLVTFGTIAQAFAPGPVTLNVAAQLSAVANNTNATCRLNGVAGTAAAAAGLTTSAQNLRLGALSWAGAICEALMYPSGLTGPQVAAAEAYLKTKWGTP